VLATVSDEGVELGLSGQPVAQDHGLRRQHGSGEEIDQRVLAARARLAGPEGHVREDIPFLIEQIRVNTNVGCDLAIEGVTREALALIEGLPWRGNVRELETASRD